LQWIIHKIFEDFLSISNFYFFSLKFGFTKNLDPEPIHQKAWIRIQIQCIWILRNTGHVTNSLNTVTRLFRLQGWTRDIRTSWGTCSAATSAISSKQLPNTSNCHRMTFNYFPPVYFDPDKSGSKKRKKEEMS
jgi:hypothetical protein